MKLTNTKKLVIKISSVLLKVSKQKDVFQPEKSVIPLDCGNLNYPLWCIIVQLQLKQWLLCCKFGKPHQSWFGLIFWVISHHSSLFDKLFHKECGDMQYTIFNLKYLSQKGDSEDVNDLFWCSDPFPFSAPGFILGISPITDDERKCQSI